MPALDPRLPIADATRRELAFSAERTRTAAGIRLLQEHLTLRGFTCAIDGETGPQTEGQTKAFQRAARLPATGRVDAATWDALVAPFVEACEVPGVKPGTDPRDVVVAVARQHLAERPTELGANQGPWVRLYMFGSSGPAWAWCAGFATFVLHQAAVALGVGATIDKVRGFRTFSCDVLADRGKRDARFIKGADVLAGRATVKPGDVFLVRSKPTDWTHTGIVLAVNGHTVTTAEGNTNRAGSREGLYAMERTRTITAALDFVRCPLEA